MPKTRADLTVAIRERERNAFASVMEAYNHTESVLGQAKSLDYSKITGGRGAQFSDNSVGTRLIEFTVDVEQLLDKNIQENELWLRSLVLDLELTTIPTEVLRIRERLGRVFIANNVYPVSSYFRSYRCKK